MNRTKLGKLLIVPFLLIVNALILTDNQNSSWQVGANLAHMGDRKCAEGEFNLKAGHKLLNNNNFKKWKESNKKLAILGVSDSSCNVCCHTEAILDKLKKEFDAKKYTGKKGKMLQIGRLDISDRDSQNVITT